jgi:hypothetical protein
VSASAFDRGLNELKGGVDNLFKSKQTLPGFLLLYTSINILASLMLPQTREATNSSYFKEWVTKYMLPSLAVRCSADDLWGARCGLLHTAMAESDMSRGKGAKTLNYIGGDAAEAKAMQQKHDPTLSHDIFLSTRNFVDAFLSACDSFAKDVRSDTDLQARVYSHAAKQMVAVN